MLAGVIYYGVSTSKFNFKNTGSPRSMGSNLHKGNNHNKEVQINTNNPTMVFLGYFETNVNYKEKSKFVVTQISAKTSDSDASYRLQDNNAIVRDIIIKEMSLKKVEQLVSPRGKEELKQKIRVELNRLIPPSEGVIEDVYFTKFIVQ